MNNEMGIDFCPRTLKNIFKVLSFFLCLRLLTSCLYYKVIPQSPDRSGIEAISKLRKRVIVHSDGLSLALSSIWFEGDSAYSNVKADYKINIIKPGTRRYTTAANGKNIPGEAHVYVRHLKKIAVPGYYRVSFALKDVWHAEENKKDTFRTIYTFMLCTVGTYASFIILTLPFSLI